MYLAQHGLTLSANSAGVPRDNPEFRVAFDAMPVPPPEATHLMTLVDVDEDGTSRIIESNEEDDRAYLRCRRGRRYWSGRSAGTCADITTYGNDGHDAGRNVYRSG